MTKNWYLKNKERISLKMKDKYIKNRDHFLEYQKKRRQSGIERILDKARRIKNPEKIRNQDALSAHKMSKIIAQRRKDEQREKYEIAMLKTENAIRYRKWTESEFNYLRDNYLIMESVDMAIELGRTYAATRRKIELLRLIKLPNRINALLIKRRKVINTLPSKK